MLINKYVLDLINLCAQNKYKIRITETIRSKQRQDELYAQGRTKPGKIVTNAKYPDSMHCWGRAFDFCRLDNKDPFYNKDMFFEKVGQLGKTLGLTWGGDFSKIKDRPHFELKGMTVSQLKAKYGTPENYFKTIK